MDNGLQLKDERNIEDIWNWFDDQLKALLDYRYKTIANVIRGGNVGAQQKFGRFLTGGPQTADELDNYFDKSERNLEHLICFDLITAGEAIIRVDFLERRKAKKRILLAKRFHELYKKKGNRASLEEDILNAWKDELSADKQHFSNFIGLLNYRNWLAHGRYWNATLGERYTPERTYEIVKNLINILYKNNRNTLN